MIYLKKNSNTCAAPVLNSQQFRNKMYFKFALSLPSWLQPLQKSEITVQLNKQVDKKC